MINVTVWCEFIQEREDPEVAAVYPHGIHEAIAEGLRREDDLFEEPLFGEPQAWTSPIRGCGRSGSTPPTC